MVDLGGFGGCELHTMLVYLRLVFSQYLAGNRYAEKWKFGESGRGREDRLEEAGPDG